MPFTRIRRSVLTLAAFVALFSISLSAQEPQGHEGHKGHEGHVPADTVGEESGTSWVPAGAPMDGFHGETRGWQLMGHGQLFAQFILESGAEHHRGHQAGSINWFMGSASRPLGDGRLTLRSMISLEPWTIPGCGYPDLLATGEVCNGDDIHDRQHPHDLFMEVAARYERPLTSSLRLQIYGGPAAEPALGPAAFPHRQSAFLNPMAPIAHHWLDSTHVAFGVITGGVMTGRWKAEVSAFNGREPDETRTDFDLGALDSLSARVSFALRPTLVMQASAGHLTEAEAGVGAFPPVDVNRFTASVSHNRRLGSGSLWATTAAYGVNSETANIATGTLPETTHALLVETSISRRDRDTWFGRAEIVGKPAHALHAHEYETLIFTVGKLQVGYVRELARWKGIAAGIGGTGMLSLVPEPLAPRYSGRAAPGFGVFATFRTRGTN